MSGVITIRSLSIPRELQNGTIDWSIVHNATTRGGAIKAHHFETPHVVGDRRQFDDQTRINEGGKTVERDGRVIELQKHLHQSLITSPILGSRRTR